MVPPSPDDVAAAVVEAALAEARRVGADVELVASIVADSGIGPDTGLALRAVSRSTESSGTTGTGDSSAPIGWAIGAAHQVAETSETRRSRGAYYTPLELARGLVGLVLDDLGSPGAPRRVCDPTCGAGGFLLCAAEHLLGCGVPVHQIGPSLVGYDIDPTAILAARLSLGIWLAAHGGEPTSPLFHVHDALHGAEPPSLGPGFDVIVGNPPFLGQLRSRSARTRTQRDSLSSTRGYADAAFVALERSLDWAGDGGRIALIQPQSVLAARDAAAVRARIDSEARLIGLWVADERIFDASVEVCAPIVEMRSEPQSPGPAHARLATYRGATVEPSGKVDFISWPELLADIQGAPQLVDFAGSWAPNHNAESLSAMAAPTADFRDWFYWIAARVREAKAVGGPDRSVPVFTSGLIDPLAPLWGLRSAKIGGRRWESPSVPVGVVEADPDAKGRLVPKILIANQTRCVEAIVDVEGTWLPITPLIAVVPRDPADLWRVAAVVLAPVSTVIAHRLAAGSGLSRGAVRLTAKMIGRLPLPAASVGAWDEAAAVVEFAVRSEPDPSLVREYLGQVARLMLSAYGLADRHDIYDWWFERLPQVVKE